MALKRDTIIFLLFLVSGFCGLLYQVVWVRMAYASFGVITPVLSVVVSVFMLGLSLGSWAGGEWISSLRKKTKVSPLIFYASAEFLIGTSAFVVPVFFSMGERYILTVGEADSLNYLLLSGLVIGISLIPWCVLMGFTFPFMMAFVKEVERWNTTSFSYLYFANVLGAMCGALISAVVLIELVGFKSTLSIAAVLNFTVAAISAALCTRNPHENLHNREPYFRSDEFKPVKVLLTKGSTFVFFILFLTGFTSMSMEITWIREFTPILKTRTYSFATLLTVYLLATWFGSYLYRKHLWQQKVFSIEKIITGLAVFSLFPIVMNDPRLGGGVPAALLSIFPFCAALGYLTPNLIDQFSLGEPRGAGKAYALNILGCIIGPLFASYILLPLLGVKGSLIVLSLPFMILFFILHKKIIFKKDASVVMGVLILVLLGIASLISVSYEELYASHEGSVVRRDHTATVVSVGHGMKKQLLVNGIGITFLTPITKFMAHLPLLLCRNKPESALVICLGMGTTHRSILSWDIQVTAVELVPSVRDALGYYFNDAERMLNSPRSKIVIDDGRRFLMRTDDKFDVITIDPPPPVEAAGSSLLYSEEFNQLAKMHLKEGGILQTWFPGGEVKILQAVTRALLNTFPYVKAYKSIEGWGIHLISSMYPIETPPLHRMISKMPEEAKNDMLEWYAVKDLPKLLKEMLNSELPVKSLLNDDKRIVVTDDRPYNEYYFLRRILAK